MSDYVAVITDKVTDRFSNSGVLLFCLYYLTFHSKKSKICEPFSIHCTFKEGQADKLLEIAFYLCYRETISIF